MKKTIWSKLIIFIMVFMTLINGILPTKVVQAGIKDPDYKDKPYQYKEYKHDDDSGYYYPSFTLTKVHTQRQISEYVKQEMSIYYIADEETMEIKYPEVDAEGRVYLEKDKIYYCMMVDIEGDTCWPHFLTYKQGNETNNYEYLRKEDNASFLEEVLTKILLWIGAGLYALVCLVVGDNFSIEKVIFNDYSNTKLSFFTNDLASTQLNPFIETSGIRPILNDFFNFFTGIALAVYLIILIYMAIRIMLGSTAEKGSKYKELLLYWLEGIIILFLFPYVMKYAIQVNNSFVSFIQVNKGGFIKEPVVEANSGDKLKDMPGKLTDLQEQIKNGEDYMSVMYQKGMDSGWLVYAICWYVMFFQMIGFLIVYFKRVLIIMFLIAVFPLVMISYAIDKIGDAKSQAFSNWVKEFMLNVFVQSFHAITYVLIMTLISTLMEDTSENWLIILIALSYISKGDDILRQIFSLNSGADTIKGIGKTVAQVAAVSSVSNGIRGIKNSLIGPNSKPRRFLGHAGNFSQKVWDKADNRVRTTAAEIELSNITVPQTLNANTLTPAEIEKNIRKDIDNLLGKNKDATKEDIQNSADRLTAYMNQTNNKEVQAIIDKLAKGLPEKDRATLDALLQQNAAANALIAGGREINISQNVNIIVSCLRRNKNGTLTRESKALLNKIANSETELDAMKLFGNVKFNKNNVVEVKVSKNRDRDRNYRARRNVTKASSNIRGRGAARTRTGIDARSRLDFMMRANGSINISRGEKRKLKRVSDKIAFGGNQNNRKRSTYKINKKQNKPWQNVRSVKNSAMAKTSSAKKSTTKSNYSLNNSKNNIKVKINNVNTSAKSNVRVEPSSKGTNNENNIFTTVSKATEIISEMKNNRGFENTINIANNIENRKTNEEHLKDSEKINKIVSELKDTKSGKYTANDILKNIDSLKEKVGKYEKGSFDEVLEMDKINKSLGCKLEDYESYVRVMILNDPDSVGNDRKIIEECKEYVKTTQMPDSIRNKLGYNLEDLKEGQNLKYVKSKDKTYDGIATDSYKTRISEEYEAKLRADRLRNEIEIRKQKDKTEYGAKSLAWDGAKLAFDAATTTADTLISTVGAAGVGFVSAGMTTDGKNDPITQATTGFFSGFGLANTVYGNAKETVGGIKDDAIEFFTSDIPKSKSKKTQSKNSKSNSEEEFIDKTIIKSESFTARGKKE